MPITKKWRHKRSTRPWRQTRAWTSLTKASSSSGSNRSRRRTTSMTTMTSTTSRRSPRRRKWCARKFKSQWARRSFLRPRCRGRCLMSTNLKSRDLRWERLQTWKKLCPSRDLERLRTLRNLKWKLLSLRKFQNKRSQDRPKPLQLRTTRHRERSKKRRNLLVHRRSKSHRKKLSKRRRLRLRRSRKPSL